MHSKQNVLKFNPLSKNNVLVRSSNHFFSHPTYFTIVKSQIPIFRMAESASTLVTEHGGLQGTHHSTRPIENLTKSLHNLKSMKGSPFQNVTNDMSDINQPLLAIATAPDIRYSVVVDAVEIDEAGKTYAISHNEPAAAQLLQPTRVQYEYPGIQIIAEIESNRIERNIRSGQKDGKAIERDERDGVVASNFDGYQRSSAINEAIRSSIYEDNLDPLFLQQISPHADSTTVVLSKEERLAEEDRRRRITVSVAPKADGYKMSEYTSIYDTGGKTFYEVNDDGYKINEYKSEYNV